MNRKWKEKNYYIHYIKHIYYIFTIYNINTWWYYIYFPLQTFAISFRNTNFKKMCDKNYVFVLKIINEIQVCNHNLKKKSVEMG